MTVKDVKGLLTRCTKLFGPKRPNDTFSAGDFGKLPRLKYRSQTVSIRCSGLPSSRTIGFPSAGSPSFKSWSVLLFPA